MKRLIVEPADTQRSLSYQEAVDSPVGTVLRQSSEGTVLLMVKSHNELLVFNGLEIYVACKTVWSGSRFIPTGERLVLK